MKKYKYFKVFFILCTIFVISSYCNVFADSYVFSNQDTTLHTKKEITQKENEIIQYNYDLSEYLVTPSSTYPYVAGSLQQGVIDDTLRNINFYRWLVGLNDVYVNYDKMERNQKGAVVLDAQKILTHTPSKPSDMDDDFYNEGAAGCYYGASYGDVYAGNVAMDYSSMPQVIDSYINDLNNIDTTYGAVGHRDNLLDPLAYAVSFGKCNSFSTLSVYYANTLKDYTKFSGKNIPSQDFFAFPCAGYFPRELFKTSEYWSLYFCYTANYSNVNVTFEYNGKEYPTDYVVEKGMPIISFKMPSELVKDLGNVYNMPECSIKVKVSGYILDSGGSDGTVEYIVNFFDKSNIVKDFTFSQEEISLTQGESKKIEISTQPSNVKPDSIKFSSSANHYLRLDENGNVTAIRPGKATVTVNVDGIEKNIVVNISKNPKYLIGDLDRNGVIDSNDASMALKLYSTTSKNNFEVEDLIYGDIDENDTIDSNDASLILELYKKK